MAKKKNNNWIIFVLLAVIAVGVAIAVFKNKGKKKGMPVEFGKVEKRTIIEKVAATGKIFPETEIKITSDVSGEVVALNVEEGDSVKQGQLLARIDPDAFQSAVERGEASVNNAKAQVANSKSSAQSAKAQISQTAAQKDQIIAQYDNLKAIHERNKSLFADGVISQMDFDASKSNLDAVNANLKSADASLLTSQANFESAQQAIKAAEFTVKSQEASLRELKTSLSRTTIKAPVDGIVSSLTVEQGERVVGTMQMAGTEMMRVANLSSMLVEVEVSENDILRVSLNDSVAIEVDAYPESTFQGVVTHVSNSASNISTGLGSALSTDQVTNFLVEVRVAPESYAELLIPGRPHPFRPGMSATVDIFTDIAEDIIAVPIQAVTTRVPEEYKDKTKKVYKEVIFAMKGDSAVMYTVTTGIQDDEYIQLTSEIPNGLNIITGPYNAVSDELEEGKKVIEKKEDEDDDKKKKWGRK
mgnify:CR=1 FL=1